MTPATIVTAALATAGILAVAAAMTVTVLAVECWGIRARVRTRLACELERRRQQVALEEIARHRARLERDLDALTGDPAPAPSGEQLGSSALALSLDAAANQGVAR